jgi:hypothetical protein
MAFTEWKRELEEKGTLAVAVQGLSMFPVIRDGSEVRLEPVTPRQIKKFDILVFCTDGTLICHYVRRVRGDEIVCDSYQFRDRDVIGTDAVLGRVTSHRLSAWQRLRCTFF